MDQPEDHIHIQNGIVELKNITTTEDIVADWMIDCFMQKGQLLSDFSISSHFLDEGAEGYLHLYLAPFPSMWLMI
jgi:hypothetical protein